MKNNGNMVSKIQGGGVNMKLGIIMLVMAIMLAGLVSAGTCTFIAPASSGLITSGSANITVRTTNASVANCTVSGSSSLTADSVAWILANYTTSTRNESANITINTRDGTDASDWTFTATCRSPDGATVDTCSVSSVTIDNTVPSCSFNSAFASRSKYSPDQVWTIAGTNATSAQIKFGNNAWWTMNEVTTGDSFTYSDQVPEAIYTVSATTSDGTNSTACSDLQYVEIDADTSMKLVAAALASDVDKKNAEAAAAQNTSGNNNYIIIGLIIVLGYFYLKKNGKI